MVYYNIIMAGGFVQPIFFLGYLFNLFSPGRRIKVVNRRARATSKSLTMSQAFHVLPYYFLLSHEETKT